MDPAGCFPSRPMWGVLSMHNGNIEPVKSLLSQQIADNYSGRCCRGDPWPSTLAHRMHRYRNMHKHTGIPKDRYQSDRLLTRS